MIETVFLGKKAFAPKIGKIGQKWGVLNLKINLVINFHWICSIIKIYVICCVSAQKSCYWDIGQNALSQWDCRIFKSSLSLEQIIGETAFFCLLIQIHEN